MSIGPQHPLEPAHEAPRSRGVEWVFAGEHGLRAGWALLLAYALFYFFRMVVGTIVAASLAGNENDYTPGRMFVIESVPLLAMLGAGALMAAIEQRRLRDYNLADARPLRRLALGGGAGIAALSALIAALGAGGWLRFGAPALAGAQILRFAVLWACTCLLVAGVEEGLSRCYLQFTLTRGLNFWWALAAQAGLCVYASVYASGNAVYGVYAAAALGLVPCLLLHRGSANDSPFWQAAWVSSTFFGMVHTFNGGENWTGILTAAGMGFIFCASLRVTGSVWWAIGCHAAWDWAETFVYGTADSGLPAQGHLLTTGPVGNPLLSGGTDGPEGSLLAMAVVTMLGLALLIYGRRKAGRARATLAQSYPVAD